MRAGSTNRLELTPDPAADSVTVSLLSGGVAVDIANVPADVSGTWYVDIAADELPTAGTEVQVDWRITRTVDGEQQIRTVTHHEWVEGYDAEPTYSAYRARHDTIAYEDWPAACEKAWQIADDVTYDRAREEVDYLDEVHAAIFRIADAIAEGTDIASETHGRHSVTYAFKMHPHQVARAALGTTGLTYQGL